MKTKKNLLKVCSSLIILLTCFLNSCGGEDEYCALCYESTYMTYHHKICAPSYFLLTLEMNNQGPDYICEEE